MVIPFPVLDESSAQTVKLAPSAAERQRLLQMGLFSAGLAHQLRHTLTALIGLSETLLEDLPGEGDFDARRHAVMLRQESLAGMRLLRLWQEYQQGVGGSAPEAVLVEEVIADAATLWRLQRPAAAVRLEMPPRPSGLRVLAPEMALRQVFLNLLCNASRAMAESGQGGVVRVDLWRKDHSVRIEVSDDGPGIPSHRQARLFEPPVWAGDGALLPEAPGESAEKPQPDGGHSGLGLWVCKWLMEQMQGEIHLRSSHPGQTCFELQLPLFDSAATQVIPPRRTRLLAAPPPVRLSFRRKPMKVLVIEDEPAVTEFLRAAFRRHGDHIHSVTSLAQARRILLRSRWDLILLDWRLGPECSSALLAWMERQRPDLIAQVMLVSGDSSSALREAARRRGLQVLEKPFTLIELWEAVRKFCAVAEEISSRAA